MTSSQYKWERMTGVRIEHIREWTKLVAMGIWQASVYARPTHWFLLTPPVLA